MQTDADNPTLDAPSRFRALASRTQPSSIAPPQSGDDLQELYGRFGLAATNAMSTAEVSKHLRAECLATLPKASKGLRRSELAAIRTDVLLRHWIDDVPLNGHHELIATLLDIVPNDAVIADLEHADWPAAMSSLKDVIALGSTGWNEGEQLRRIHQQAWNAARGAGYLRRRGYGVAVSNGVVVVADGGREVMTFVRNLIQRYGAQAFLQDVFGFLAEALDPDFDRWFVGRRPTQDGSAAVQVPWNLLVQLAIQVWDVPSIHVRAGRQERAQIWRRVLCETTALTATLSVQPYSMWSGFFVAYDTLADYLSDAAAYDSLFTFRQLRRSHAHEIALGLLDWVETEHGLNVGLERRTVASVMTKVLGGGAGPRILKLNEFTSAELDVVRALSFEAGEPNRGFSSLAELGALNSSERPLFVLRGDSVGRVDSRLAARSFLNRIIELLEARCPPSVRRDLGLAVETIFHKKFREKGISCGSGEYAARSGQVGELDGLVDSSTAIDIFEAKKIALGTDGHTGNLPKMLFRIAKSLVHSQTQLVRAHETLLRDGTMRLTDGTVVAHDSKRVRRITVTLQEYDGLQDRMAPMNLLDVFSRAKFDSNDPDVRRDMDRVTKLGEALAAAVVALQAHDTGGAPPWHATWFVSLSFLLQVLDDASDVEDFAARLAKLGAISGGTRDLFTDYRWRLRLEERVARETAT